jgi:hypothetical protein
MRKTSLTAVGFALLWSATAMAKPTPAQKCQASKNKAAGKYAICRENAEAKLALTGDTTKYDAAITKCETKYQSAWQKAEQKAVDAGSTCTTTADQTAVQGVTDEFTNNVAQHLGGAPLIDCSVALATCNANYTSCSGSLATCNAGTAAVGDVLSGKTFSSSTGLGVTGTMVNVGQQNVMPGTQPVTITQGYHDGSGTVAGDTDLAAGNIKSGVTIFGVTGSFSPPTCGNAVVEGTEQCDLGSLNGETCVTQGFAGGTLRCGAGCVLDASGCYATRYVDNADGTITDNQTGLQWEKKLKLDSTQDFINLQDADNTYKWAGQCTITTSKDCQPTAEASAACTAGEGNTSGCAECTGGEGTCNATSTVWTWLVALNAANFGSQNDWRMPTRAEVESILDLTVATSPDIDVAFHGASCGTGCADVTSAACACTRASTYWAGTYPFDQIYAWWINFGGGNVTHFEKTNSAYVRAVRGGS